MKKARRMKASPFPNRGGESGDARRIVMLWLGGRLMMLIVMHVAMLIMLHRLPGHVGLRLVERLGFLRGRGRAGDFALDFVFRGFCN